MFKYSELIMPALVYISRHEGNQDYNNIKKISDAIVNKEKFKVNFWH